MLCHAVPRAVACRSDEVDDMLIQLQARLSSCSAAGLNSIIAALPAMGSGARLKTVVNQAVAR